MSTTITRSQLKLLIEDEHNIMVTEKENSFASKAGHTVLDVIGLVPGWGEYADVINAAAYAREGNYLLAALSAISVIPVIGDAVGKGGKVTLWFAKTFPKAAKQIEKYGPTLVKNIRGIRDLIQKHDKEIKKFLKFAQENTDGSKIRPYLEDIEKAIDILGGKSGKSDEEVADLLQKEYSGTAVKPEMGNEEPDAKSAGLSIKIDKNQDGIPDSKQSQADLGKFAGSGNNAGGSQSSGMPFTTDGKMNPVYMKWENQKAANEIISMIYEEAALVFEQKKSSNDITKSMLKEIIVEEYQAQIMINEGLGDILRTIGGASIQKLKHWIVDLIADLFGVDKTTALYEFVSNMAEDFTFEDFMDLLLGREGRCITIGQEISHAIQETLLENLPEILGLETADADINRSPLYKVVKEIVVEAFTSDALDDFIAQKICAKIGLAAPGDDPEDDALAIVSAEI